MGGIDIHTATVVLLVAAAILAPISLLFLARVGPGALGAGLLSGLGMLAVVVVTGLSASLDAAVDGWLRPHLTPVVRTAAADLHTYLGQPVHFATVVVFCGLLISLHTRSLLPVPLITGAVGVGVVVEESLKAALAPHGFPSGHVTVTATFLGTVAVCLGRRRGRAAHVLLAALASTGVAIVAVNTLVSGAHTLTEAIGGMVLGGSLVAAGASAQRAAVPARRVAQRAVPARRIAAATGPDAPTVVLPSGATRSRRRAPAA